MRIEELSLKLLNLGSRLPVQQNFLAEAEALHVPEAWLEVSVENPAAIALYRAYDFEDVRIRPRYYQPEDVDAIVMRKQLR